MPIIQRDIDLKSLHTFHMPVKARLLCEVNSVEDILSLREYEELGVASWLILGGGSNVLFTADVEQPVVKISIPGISILRRDDHSAVVKIGAGVLWHDLVVWSLRENLSGIENLSLIPGLCGAAPMQNIGAYGVELVQVFESLEAVELVTGHVHTFRRDECAFGYRSSIFKTELRNHFVITSITLRLQSGSPVLNLDYGDIRAVLSDSGISRPTPRDVSKAVIQIRQSKLPDPAVIGNAGSFFKNPEIDEHQFFELKSRFSDVPGYPATDNKVKVPAGWLIDRLGLKGYREGDAGVHDRQALVLVNHGNATGDQILSIAKHIQKSVHTTYGINLEPEVNII